MPKHIVRAEIFVLNSSAGAAACLYRSLKKPNELLIQLDLQIAPNYLRNAIVSRLQADFSISTAHANLSSLEQAATSGAELAQLRGRTEKMTQAARYVDVAKRS